MFHWGFIHVLIGSHNMFNSFLANGIFPDDWSRLWLLLLYQWFPFGMLHPQVWYSPGNNIGPLLFLLYINDLPNCLSHTEPRMNADDIHLTYSNGNIHSIQSSQNEDLLNINRWLTANKLTPNMTKTEFGLTGSRQKLNNLLSLPSLNINNDRIKHSYCSKSLSVLIDENQTWENYVDALSEKIASGVGAIKRINHCLLLMASHDVCYGLFQSHFEYCSVVWGSDSRTV